MATQEPDLIIGIDPGGTTGIAWWHRSTGAYNSKQVQSCRLNDRLWEVIETVTTLTTEPTVNRKLAHVVVEKFEFRLEERDRTKIDYTAAEVIGALRLWSIVHSADECGWDVDLIMQGATKAKGFWTDEKLKDMGVWVPGHKHAMDALRHVLAHRVFTLDDKAVLQVFRPDPRSIGTISVEGHVIQPQGFEWTVE